MIDIDKKIIFLLLFFLAFVNFILFGFSQAPPDGDAVQYITYGENLALGHGYSLDGKTFDTTREPGYPLFLFFIFKLFGLGNLLAVKLSQAVLLALTALFIYLSFELYERQKAGLVAAIITALIPTYGHYANLLYSESFFLFLLVFCFYLTLRIFKKEEKVFFYGLAGFVFALAVLTKIFILFLPLLIGARLFWVGRQNVKNIIIFYFIFFLLIGGWASYVYYKTGTFTITQGGRQENHLYNRAIRSTLSYKQSLYYLYSWIRRSALGGTENEILQKYDLRPLSNQYKKMAEQGYSFNQIRSKSIALILSNPGHYLFGNITEWIKLVWIEHLYPPVSPLLGRYVRLGFYILLYGLFAAGSVRFLKNRQHELRPVFWLAAVFLSYNWIIMSFLDSFPRFNMPYLVFYLVIGIAGLAKAKQV